MSCIFSKESCSYISGNGNPEKNSYLFLKESWSYTLGKWNFVAQSWKNFSYLGREFENPENQKNFIVFLVRKQNL